jgi:hypothetical protein
MTMSDVLDFLKGQVGRVFSVREISKEVDEGRFERDKTWASHELKSLCSKGFIETTNGCYWIPPHEEEEEAEHLEKEGDENAPIESRSEEDPAKDQSSPK